MLHLAIETTERTALDAARAEGRAEAADELHKVVGHWFKKYAELVACELDDVGRSRFLQFRDALAETLAAKVEAYRRDHSRAIDDYVADRKAFAAREAQ